MSFAEAGDGIPVGSVRILPCGTITSNRHRRRRRDEQASQELPSANDHRALPTTLHSQLLSSDNEPDMRSLDSCMQDYMDNVSSDDPRCASLLVAVEW
jgi:hypothetical protein